MKGVINLRCTYCLCHVCDMFNCPWGRYHCLPCHGQVLDCDFFRNKLVSKVYRIKKRSPAVRLDDLVKLKETIDQILADRNEEQPEPQKSIQVQLAEENQRHRRALREIIKNAQKPKSE